LNHHAKKDPKDTTQTLTLNAITSIDWCQVLDFNSCFAICQPQPSASATSTKMMVPIVL